jgi:hypothetical protein
MSFPSDVRKEEPGEEPKTKSPIGYFNGNPLDEIKRLRVIY